jgi:hypothetical protein
MHGERETIRKAGKYFAREIVILGRMATATLQEAFFQTACAGQGTRGGLSERKNRIESGFNHGRLMVPKEQTDKGTNLVYGILRIKLPRLSRGLNV